MADLAQVKSEIPLSTTRFDVQAVENAAVHPVCFGVAVDAQYINAQGAPHITQTLPPEGGAEAERPERFGSASLESSLSSVLSAVVRQQKCAIRMRIRRALAE